MYVVGHPCTTSSVASGTFRAASQVLGHRRTLVSVPVPSTYHSPRLGVSEQSETLFTRPYRDEGRFGADRSTFSTPRPSSSSSLGLTVTSHGSTTWRILMSASSTLAPLA